MYRICPECDTRCISNRFENEDGITVVHTCVTCSSIAAEYSPYKPLERVTVTVELAQ